MAKALERRADRIVGVDAWRFIAITGVVAIHTTPEAVATPGHWLDASYLLNQAARFAVPFFFVVSGYFWGMRVANPANAFRVSLPTVRRLVVLFVVWSMVYALPYDVTPSDPGEPLKPLREWWWHLSGLAARPLTSLTQGTKSHLWFLPALVCAITIAACCVRLRQPMALAVIGALLYIVQLLSKPYALTEWGLPIAFNTRNGPFVGTAFFATGYLLSRTSGSRHWYGIGLALVVSGFLLHCAENWFVVTQLGAVPLQDFVIGTYPMGVGAAMMALSGRSFTDARVLALLGRDALGIYLLHAIFVDWFWRVRHVSSTAIAAHLMSIIAVLASTWIAVQLLSRLRWARRFLV